MARRWQTVQVVLTEYINGCCCNDGTIPSPSMSTFRQCPACVYLHPHPSEAGVQPAGPSWGGGGPLPGCVDPLDSWLPPARRSRAAGRSCAEGRTPRQLCHSLSTCYGIPAHLQHQHLHLRCITSWLLLPLRGCFFGKTCLSTPLTKLLMHTLSLFCHPGLPVWAAPAPAAAHPSHGHSVTTHLQGHRGGRQQQQQWQRQ
jgi:hypothetical protein